MVVEARYTPGRGILIGAGALWVLVTDPGDDDVLGTLWDVVASLRESEAPSTVDRVLDVVERAFDGAPPALAVADLTPGAATTLVRGSGRVRLVGTTRVLSLEGEVDPTAPRPTRRLVGGVVGASAAEVLPVEPHAAPSDGPSGAGLIDGIPDSILAATGPDGPPPPRPRQHAPQWIAPADTASSVDTTDPHPALLERIEEGGHTTIRTTRPTPDQSGGGADHDGSTVHRPAHLTRSDVPTVLAVSCPLGHLTSPSTPTCRLCHQRVAPQEPRQVHRPTLGGLRLPTGEVVPLDRGVVLGRKPAPPDDSHDWPHLVHLPADHSFVSRMHLQIDLVGWDVVARDLDSRGGTTLAQPGREAHRMAPHEAYVLEPGATLDLAEVYEVRYETGPVISR